MYLQPDPLGMGGGDPTLYAYAKNNPLRYFDPDGKRIVTSTAFERQIIDFLKLNPTIGWEVRRLDELQWFVVTVRQDPLGGGEWRANDDCTSGTVWYGNPEALQDYLREHGMPEAVAGTYYDTTIAHELAHAWGYMNRMAPIEGVPGIPGYEVLPLFWENAIRTWDRQPPGLIFDVRPGPERRRYY